MVRLVLQAEQHITQREAKRTAPVKPVSNTHTNSQLLRRGSGSRRSTPVSANHSTNRALRPARR